MEITSKKVVIVTGAASGIGLELVKYYDQKNFIVVGMDCNQASLEKREKEFPKVDWVCADICNRVQMEQAAKRAIAAYKRVDIVIANAGVGGLNPSESFDLDIHEKSVMINCLGLAYTLVPYIDIVKRFEGSLVGISSMAAFRGLPKAATYSSTKAMQKIFLESLRVDLRKSNVNVLCVHPGFVKTAMTNHTAFKMPFMVDAPNAALKIAKAISKRKSKLLFPFPMKVATYINRLLPNWLYDRFVPMISKFKPDTRAQIL